MHEQHLHYDRVITLNSSAQAPECVDVSNPAVHTVYLTTPFILGGHIWPLSPLRVEHVRH
jgi:hypothetical protein